MVSTFEAHACVKHFTYLYAVCVTGLRVSLRNSLLLVEKHFLLVFESHFVIVLLPFSTLLGELMDDTISLLMHQEAII